MSHNIYITGRKACTIFPMALNFNQNGEQKRLSCAFISDTKKHGAEEVYAFIHTLNEFLFTHFPERKYMIFMSDGAASHFKQRNNLLNVAMHQFDFRGIRAEWNFQG